MTDPGAARAESYLAPETLAQLAPFHLRAKMIVEGVMSGMHRSPYQGMAVEFAEHRQYVAGDDLRHVDWKVYGRTDKLYIKQYQQETNLDVILMVDASASMGYGSLSVKSGWGGTTASDRVARWTKFDHAVALSIAIAYLCLAQQDRVGLVVFADDIRTMIRRSGAQGQWRKIVNALRTEPVEAPTNLAKVTDQVLSKVQNRALFVLISDLFEDAETIRQTLARFKHRRHDLLVLNTLDRQELRFGFDQPAPFVGMEGEGRLRLDPRMIREAYLAALESHLEQIAQNARSFGFDALRIDTHDSVGPPLAYVLARRAAMLKRSGVG